MTTFSEARVAVEVSIGLTQDHGFEDDEDFNVLLEEPETDDLVTLVSKEDAVVRQDPRWVIEEKLRKMTPVDGS